MAARGFKIETGELTLEASAKTLMHIEAPASFPIAVHQIYITQMEAATGEQPVYSFVQQDQDGTEAGDLTPVQWGPIYGTIQSTARYGPFTVEPATDRLLTLPTIILPPQGGYIWQGYEIIEPGKALGILGSQAGGGAKVRIAAFCSE